MDKCSEKYTKCCGNIEETFTSGKKRNLRKASWEKVTSKCAFENGIGFQQMKIREGHCTLKDMSSELKWRKSMVCGDKGVKEQSRV